MATKYEARKPINHKGTHYRPGDEITGFTGWWRYWQYLRYARVIKLDDAAAPVIDTLVAGDTILTVNFTQGDDGGSPFTNYEYQLDGGSWVAFNPVITDSPGVISGLTNGQEYLVRIRAVTVEMADGASSNQLAATPVTTPAAPSALVATPGDGELSIAFTPGSDGGSAITNYEYRVAPSSTYIAFDPVDTSSPVVITGLDNGVEVTVYIRAINAAGTGASASVTGTPVTVPDAPTALIATPGNTTASIAFTAPASDGGSAITDYEYRVDAGSWTTGATVASPVVVTGLVNDVEVSIDLRAVSAVGNGAASTAVLVTPTA